ncbi:MAG: hypothetical protein Q3962_04160 [Corynebacterium sp.]|nr:hypothetical protein [Corynebacterium sp.]
MNNNNPFDPNMIYDGIRNVLFAIAAFVALVGLIAPNSIKAPESAAPTTTVTSTVKLGPNGNNTEFNREFSAAFASLAQSNALVLGDNSQNYAMDMAETAASGADVTGKVPNIRWILWIKDNERDKSPQQIAQDFYTDKRDDIHSSTGNGQWSIAILPGRQANDVIVVYAYIMP